MLKVGCGCGTVAPCPGGPWPPLLLSPSENCQCCRKIANVVGKLTRLSEIVKVVDGGGGGVKI